MSPLALFFLSVIIARSLGPVVQGQFSTAKALFDLLVAFGSFGFPQSVIFAINRYGVSQIQLYRDAVLYSIVVILLLLLFLSILPNWQDQTFLFSLLFAIGAAGFVLTHIWRGILLTIDDGIFFNLITIAPAISLTLSVGIFFGLLHKFDVQAISYVFGLAGLSSIFFSYLLFRNAKNKNLKGVKPNYSKLILNGMDVFIQAVAMAGQTYYFLFYLAKTQGHNYSGYFSVALIAFQAFLLPLQMVSPLILNTWSKEKKQATTIGFGISNRVYISCAITFILIVVFFGGDVVYFLYGLTFDPAISGIKITLLSVLPSVLIRIIALRLASLGAFRQNSVVAIIRLFMAVLILHVGFWWEFSFFNVATIAAIAWFLAEVSGAILAWFLLKQASSPVKFY